jgi:hypothetical protein
MSQFLKLHVRVENSVDDPHEIFIVSLLIYSMSCQPI